MKLSIYADRQSRMVDRTDGEPVEKGLIRIAVITFDDEDIKDKEALRKGLVNAFHQGAMWASSGNRMIPVPTP